MSCTTETDTRQIQTIGTGMALLLAFVSGAAVANVYYAQPLLDDLGLQLHMSAAQLGWVTTATQGGYLLGLILVVPLGDRFDRRRIILVQLAVTALGLLGAAVAPSAWTFLAFCALFGAASTVVQVITAFAATTSPPDRRGRTVGAVTTGVVLGILLARTVSGAIAGLWGWRAVFVVAALAMVAVSGWLAATLPRDTVEKVAAPYRRAITSVVALSRSDRAFRVRSLIGGLMFASFGAAWGSMALPLAAQPWHLTTTQIGLFGIVGAAGALGASGAGRWADAGHAQLATGGMLVVFLASWLAIAQAPSSLLLLGIGLIALDFAGEALHVINQHIIVESDPTATTSLIGGYMVYYSIGTGLGAIAATVAYAHTGWSGTSVVGAVFALAALGVWIGDRLR
ncbi:MFS transporter [Mycolicibacterium mucogenicum]|uniref:MFS transporter n=1 Tax=Mycolicibacterium mucogenicum DSM 44124 TaxID=1226753 RepID=A0A8H2JD37_MYCMU|nr:MFS transporter [Mycolicibacterium mucogenicum]KAB7757657.1 MFS transporter [Mycolicibacterium mucogenicum DSM 44124]QPG71992.1 MFS transporter [Mycolicibacterium mucogenicum DSM 44124]